MRLKRFITSYHPRFVRSLVYMLQASEYMVRDYLAWFWQVGDFRYVEKRKTLVPTLKARLLMGAAWVLWLALAITTAWLIMGLNGVVEQSLAGIAGVIFLPVVVAYALPLPLFLGGIIQVPMQRSIVRSARHKLSSHSGVKIAIAGSYGKTSMREILKTVLLEGKNVAAPPHSYNTPLGISSFIQGLKGDEEVLIFELGEYYPGDVKKLCELVQPNMGVITGINEAHLDKFKTLEKTVSTIFELSDYVGTKDVYVNGENDLVAQAALPSHIRYSRSGVDAGVVSNAVTDLNGTSFTLKLEGETYVLKSGLLGTHQIGPLVAAVSIARKLGLTKQLIEAGISKTRPFDHRLEPKRDASGVITLDDSYNGNPDGVAAVISFLAGLTDHRRWYVTPGLVEMGNKTREVHTEIGAQLARANIERVVLIKNSVTGYIAEGLEAAGFKGKLFWFDDALSAFAALPNLTVPGDVVLLQNDWPDQYS